MHARTSWKVVTVDRSNLLDRFFELLRVHKIEFCLVGGQALNAYVEPVVSLDLDIVLAADRVTNLEPLLAQQFNVQRFAHRLNVSDHSSDLRIQIQLDSRYEGFIGRAQVGEVLGLRLPVASIDDVLQGKIWAVEDPTRRGSKRQKDLADIARVLESYPHLRPRVPPDVLTRLL
jgi:hypothetical protein